MPTQDYPQPFLVPALAALKHKQRIKRMDYSIASKAIDAIRLIKAGDKDFPLEEDDPMLDDIKAQMNQRDNAFVDTIYTLYVNHTVQAEWIYPPLDALLSQDKYNAPNTDILVAMGFSKVMLIGESERSNAGQQNNSMVGPLATLQEMRRLILRWVTDLYKELRDDNGFVNIPTPTFRPITAGDLAALASFAIQAQTARAASKDLIARMLGSDYETEIDQIKYEDEADPPPEPIEPESSTPPSGE